MKVLYLECGMGAAGDMLTAALASLLPDRDAFAERMNEIGIPGLKMSFVDKTSCGIVGNHAHVVINGEEEISNDVDLNGVDLAHSHDHHHEHEHSHHHEHTHDHHHEHSHDHHHDHHHAGLADIMAIVNGLDIPEAVKIDVEGVYSLIAEAEANAHGTEAAHIHFHEVGMMDAVCDVTAVCLLMHMLNPDRVIVSPVCTGYGEVRCMHGIVPVPSPAAAYLLQDVPTYAGHIRAELITPTGAALLKYFANEFAQRPVMRIHKIGHGMGSKEFESVNCVRAMLGEIETATNDSVCEISCNIDDMTGEAISFAAETLRDAGALDVYYTPIQMKKDRPGIKLSCLCREEDEERFSTLILQHTNTIGVRICPMRRRVLDRRIETVDTKYGPVRCKISEGYGVKRRKAEYEDCADIARKNGITIEDVIREVGTV